MLIQTLSSDVKKASEYLIQVIDYLDKKYKIEEIIYANGPGSFMGVKVSYIILRTFCIVKSIPMSAVSGFELNSNMPIKANKHLSFVLENSVIKLKKIEPVELKLPKNLSGLNKTTDILPNYVMEAV